MISDFSSLVWQGFVLTLEVSMALVSLVRRLPLGLARINLQTKPR